MNLVDLKGRQDEPEVLSVLKQSHGSQAALDEACAHYEAGDWQFIGWQEGDEILACVGAEQLVDAIGIRSIAVLPDWRNRGLARSLIDALVERTGAARVVAETDDDAVGFYRCCAFTVADAPPKFGRPRYWCVRELN